MSIRLCLRVCLSLVLLVIAGSAEAQTGTTAIYFDSQPGDSIGGGLQRTWTENDLVFSARASGDRSSVTISANAPTFSTWWTLDFAAPQGVPLTPGVYEYATRNQIHLNGLSVWGTGGSCGESVGRFRVLEFVLNASGAVDRFAADFEQHCNGQGPALFGAVRYRSTHASLLPFDGAYPIYSLQVDEAVNGFVTGHGIDCGAGRTDCEEVFGTPTSIALTATPNPGYVFLGWAGVDCVGVATVIVDVNRAKYCQPIFNAAPGGPGGELPNYAIEAVFLDGWFGSWGVSPAGGRSQSVFVPPYSRLVVQSATLSSVSFRIDHPAISLGTLEFAAAPGGTLSPGLFHPTTASRFEGLGPYLNVSLQSSGCSAAGGRFRIYEMTFAGPTLSSFSADFEVPCHNGRYLTGSVRYNAARESLLPFDGVYPSSTVTVVPTIGGYVTSAGIDCGDGGRSDCEEPFVPPSIASFQATASPGYQFFGWAGLCTGSNPIVAIAMSASGRCLAVFHPVAGAPSHPFGNEFMLIERSGGTPSQSLWLPPESGLRVSVGGNSLWFSATDLFNETGSVSFMIPTGRILAGEYEALEETGVRLQVSACSTSRGFFKVHEAEYNPDGTLAGFAADFEAYCTSSTTYVSGAIRYRSTRHVIKPFNGAYPVIRLRATRSPYGHVVASGIACGPAATDCVEIYGSAMVRSIQATPSAGYAFVGWRGDCSGGSYTYLLIDRTRWCEPLFRAVHAWLPQDPRLAGGSVTIHSQPGEPIGGGISKTELTDDWSVFTFNSRRHLHVNPWDTPWRMEFRAAGTAVLGVGRYDGAVSISGPAASPGLSIFGQGPSCPSANVRGRFVIHELTFTSATSSSVQSLAVDFEQRCSNGPLLRGSIRFRSNRSVLEPFAGETPHTFTRFDFTGDQHPDLVWQNRNDGRLLFWQLQGAAYAFNEPASIASVGDTNWQIVGTADADSDGYNDLYWQHQASGALAIWYLRGTQVVRTQMMTPGAVADTNWQIRTVYDVDRDGDPDLIWQHRLSGQIAVWYMQGAMLQTSALIGPGGIADPNWAIVGAGDADGDGRTDLYWHHQTSGHLAIWYMDGVRLLSSALLTPSAVADTNWRVRGIADVNRDGSPDLIWQNESTSAVAVWLMTGSRVYESRILGGPTMTASEWTLVGPR